MNLAQTALELYYAMLRINELARIAKKTVNVDSLNIDKRPTGNHTWDYYITAELI